MLRLMAIGQLLLVVSALLGVPCRAEQPLAEGVIVPLNVSVKIVATSPTPISWTKDFERPASRFICLHFSSIADQSAISDYKVILRDRNWNVLRSYTRAEFSSREQFWSPLILGEYVSVEVSSAVAPSGLEFQIGEIAFFKAGFVKYSLVHNPPELEPIMAYRTIPEIYDPSRAVAKLVFSANGLSDACTGFLISTDTLLTNQHCIDREETCKNNAVALFGYEQSTNGLQQGQQFDCVALILQDPSLDFSLIRLDGSPGLKYGNLKLTRRPVGLLEQTFLIQHPAGEPKQIARKECFVSTLDADANKPDTDIGHMCDTMGGASGSPLLGKDYNVIGLHHLGFDLVGRWKGENRAVQIDKVMDRLGL